MELESLIVYDNGGETIDRYTVLITAPEDRDVPEYWKARKYWESLGLSRNCDHPQGFSLWCDALPGDHLGTIIAFSDLPGNVQEHVKRRLA